MEREKKRGGMRGSSERRHRREGLGIRIESEKIGGRKKVWGSDFSVGKFRFEATQVPKTGRNES